MKNYCVSVVIKKKCIRFKAVPSNDEQLMAHTGTWTNYYDFYSFNSNLNQNMEKISRFMNNAGLGSKQRFTAFDLNILNLNFNVVTVNQAVHTFTFDSNRQQCFR